MKRLYVTPRTARHETVFLSDFAENIERLGYLRTADPQKADLSLVWGWRRAVPEQPTIFVEAGWIPRWHYQVSPCGLNYQSHLKRMPDTPISPFLMRQASDWLWKHRAAKPTDSAFLYADPTGVPFDFGYDYLLAPLQVDGDANLNISLIKSMDEFIDEISFRDPPFPVVFRGHPARVAQHSALESQRPGDRVFLDPRITVHQMLKSIRCLGVIALNSNVVHDAMVWGKDIWAFAQGPWPTTLFQSGFPCARETYAPTWPHSQERLRYVHRLTEVQWAPDEAKSLERVRKMVESAYEEIRPKPQVVFR